MKAIAVFGSSMPQADQPDYVDALAVGRVLGQAGFAVMTGGFGGVMEAASRGAAEAGAHVIGVTCQEIVAIRPGAKANPWVAQEINYMTLNERLTHLITHADGYVVMPGGVGTLNELVLAWELMRVHVIPDKPVICFGRFWAAVMEPLLASSYVPDQHKAMLQFADTPQDVLMYLPKG